MNKVLDLLTRNQISEKELADRIGILPSTVSKLVNNKIHLKDDIIIKICKEYNVTSDWLLGVSDNNNLSKCYYTRRKHNWVSGCGWRVNYNKHWIYCPHCGKSISIIK